MTPFWVTAFLDVESDAFDRALKFWRAVTGYAVSPRRGDTGEFLSLLPDGPEPADDYLRMQRLGAGPSRVHLDLHVTDPAAEAARAVALGATDVADHGYRVMRSPAGIAFCLVTQPASRVAAPATWPGGRSRVDQVSIDVGPSAHDAERQFWHELTGFPSTPATGDEFSRMDGAGMPLRFLVQRLDDDRPAGLHLDLSADDRAAEVARHAALGAEVERTAAEFTVLRDPAGSAYCVTDRTPGRAWGRGPVSDG